MLPYWINLRVRQKNNPSRIFRKGCFVWVNHWAAANLPQKDVFLPPVLLMECAHTVYMPITLARFPKAVNRFVQICEWQG
ncbi:hypothetical protein ANRL4_02524 [Anaerolineae bacterium]|nr:hypothetical protein ANRL4_02524 [Anaerolineae bacterium]